METKTNDEAKLGVVLSSLGNDTLDFCRTPAAYGRRFYAVLQGPARDGRLP